MENKERNLAKEYILNTSKSIFLTGKAGTGKTTLLREVLAETDKNHMIAAPTGVAAINAGGVTLHSLFSFPLQAFIPEQNFRLSPDLFCDYAGLVKHQKFNRAKLDLFLELELLVIDEISMVRVDLLDAIDFTLRRVRKNSTPFGGVQLLVIGDLYQLSPVVRHNIKLGLSEYYKSPYFFDGQAWAKMDALTIELKKVYRQEDQVFVDLLNAVRVGDRDQAVIDKINERYAPDAKSSEGITLTTHNNQANAINQSELEALDSEELSFSATVNGKFPENSFPAEEEIILKVGAQVMFIRNHSEGLYYNGKIGQVTEVTDRFVKVIGDDNVTIIVEPVEWKNTRYEVDPDSDKIVKNDVGSFEQYPLRLAWAVTVHKSQGLTFDKLVLDLEKTFAAGQLYVALSRCRTMEGMSLLSKVKLDNLITDSRIVGFYNQAEDLSEAVALLPEAKAAYERERILRSFAVQKLFTYMEQWQELLLEKDIRGKAQCQKLINELNSDLSQLDSVSKNFIHKMKAYFSNEKIEQSFVTERVAKAVKYFTDEIHEKILTPTIKHQAEYSIKKNTKAYLRGVDAMEIATAKHISKLYKLEYLGKPVYDGEQKNIVISSKPKGKKATKGSTILVTYEMYKEGKKLELIAKERGLAIGTIETHMARLITDQKVSIYDLMDKKKVEKALAVAEAHTDLSLTDLIKKVPFKVSFGQLRWVTAYRDMIG